MLLLRVYERVSSYWSEKACKITTIFPYTQIFSKENAKKMQIFAKCKV